VILAPPDTVNGPHWIGVDQGGLRGVEPLFRIVGIIISGVLATAGPAALLVVQTTVGGTMALTWLCLLISITAFGVFFPAVITIAQSRGRTAPGATSALLRGSQFPFGAAVSPLVGLFGAHSPAPMAAVMATCLTLATLAAVATKRTRRR
jgi:DHA1 family bicyclomycin/chloramphenicol resistance-like MFS transporter